MKFSRSCLAAAALAAGVSAQDDAQLNGNVVAYDYVSCRQP